MSAALEGAIATRVLWSANTVFPDVATQLDIARPTSGAWMFALAEALMANGDFRLGVLSPYGGSQPLRLSMNGIEHYLVPWRSSEHIWGPSRRTRRNIEYAISEFRPDLVHLNGTESGLVRYIQRRAGVPTVISIQGLASACAQVCWADLGIWGAFSSRTVRDWFRFNGIVEQRLLLSVLGRRERAVIRDASHIVGRTAWDRQMVLGWNGRAHYHHCEEMVRSAFYQHAWRSEGAVTHRIFAPSSASPLKGFHVLLRAAHNLRRHFPDLTVHVTGCDPRANGTGHWRKGRGYAWYLRRLMDQMELHETVRFLGSIGADEMATEMAEASVVVISSAVENSSNALAEAMLVGTPCVVSRVGGLPSMMTEGLEGIFYPFGDVGALASAIRSIWQSPENARTLSGNARRRAVTRHDPTAIVRQISEVYRMAIATPSVPRPPRVQEVPRA